MKRKGIGPDGLVIVDKPSGLTSHDVVSRMRRLAGTRRVGHAGTLDPMATGVLVIGVEKATRLLGHLALTEKEYRATIRLGQTTVTDDAEGEITASQGAREVPPGAVDAGIAGLTGDIMQVPSKVSAIKIDGKRSYKRVLEGEDVEIPARPVTVTSFALHEVREAVAEDGTAVLDLDVTVECSSGTYIRALARDLGADLGAGGHLTALRRTRVGPYGLSAAWTLERLRDAVGESGAGVGPEDASGDVSGAGAGAGAGGGGGLPVMPIAEAAAAAFPRWDVDAERARLLSHGVRLAAPPELGEGPTAVFDPEGRFLALVEPVEGKVKALAVFV